MHVEKARRNPSAGLHFPTHHLLRLLSAGGQQNIVVAEIGVRGPLFGGGSKCLSFLPGGQQILEVIPALSLQNHPV